MQAANNVTGYNDYFLQLARTHKDILHNPEWEDPAKDPVSGTKKFMRISVQEVLTSLPKEAGYPLMTLELYDNTHKAENPLNIIGKYKGAFSIIENVPNGKYEDQLEAYAKCERIAHEILQQIWVHHYGPMTKRCQTPFSDIDFNQLEIIFISGVFSGNEYGVRVEFAFEFNQTSQIAKKPADGTFIEP